MPRNKKRNFDLSLRNNPLRILGLSVAGLILLVLVLELTNVTRFFHKTVVSPVIPVSSSSSTPTSSQSSQQSSSSSKGAGSPVSSGNGSSKVNLPLYAPYGDFVSNHRPNLSGSPAPSQETSVCNTTPGAKCYIRFTQGSVTTSLPAQTTDSKGTTYWGWDVKKAGLTNGSWTITALATLNGQTKTTQDPLMLDVAK